MSAVQVFRKHCFLPVSKLFCHFHWIWIYHLQGLSLWKSLKFVVWELEGCQTLLKWLNKYHWLKRKHSGQKAKMMVTSIFSLTLYQTTKSSDQSKLKALADDKINVTQKLKFVSGRVENILGKGENAGYQHFLLLPKCFQKSSSSGSLKIEIVW